MQRSNLYLKELNLEDIEKEYEYITEVPVDENGFMNDAYGCSREDFEEILRRLINHSKGLDLPEGFVPETHCMLWMDDTIIGWFRIRHYLCLSLVEGGGHIGYSIRQGYRGRGYGSEGLRLTLEKAKDIIPEDEFYLRVNRDNPASLHVMLHNGGYIHHENEAHYHVRIKK